MESLTMSDVIILLGAGASKDAGLPLIDEITDDFYSYFRNDKFLEDYIRLFDAISDYDKSARENYENLFHWINLISKTSCYPYNRAIYSKFNHDQLKAINFLLFSGNIKHAISDILNTYQQNSYPRDYAYLANLSKFQSKGPLKVFTTNYDLLVERACNQAQNETHCTTGFDRNYGQWNPSLFEECNNGINLYKLHGSLSWEIHSQIGAQLVQPSQIESVESPQIILGPESKLQYDEPFVSLYSEFHKALREAKVCVIIGCALNDVHIREPVYNSVNDELRTRKCKIIEVNKRPCVKKLKAKTIRFNDYTKSVLQCDEIFDVVHKILNNT